MVKKLVQELKDCCSAMVELFVMTVLVITLLTLFVAKWASLGDIAGETQTNGFYSKLLSIYHLTTSGVEVENLTLVPITLNTIASTARMYFLLVTQTILVSVQNQLTIMIVSHVAVSAMQLLL